MPVAQKPSRLAPLVVLAWAAIAGSAEPVIKIRVAPSGQGLAIESFEPDGVTPARITGFGGTDEVQRLTFAGVPKAQGFAIEVDGKATAPIPFRRVPPSSAFTFNVALPGPGTYDVQASVPYPRGAAAPNIYAIHDGVIPVGPPIEVEMGIRSPKVAGAYLDPSGSAFRPLGRFRFATGLASIDVYAAPGSGIYASAVRLVPSGGGPAILVRMTDPANTCYGPDRVVLLAGARPSTDLEEAFEGKYYGFVENGAHGGVQPARWYAEAGDVRAALSALPGLAGAIEVEGKFAVGTPQGSPPTPAGPASLVLKYGGPKRALAVGLPGLSDPAVVGSRSFAGGRPWRYRINGGPELPVPPGSMSFQGVPLTYFYAPFRQSDIYPETVAGRYVAKADGYTFNFVGQHDSSLNGPPVRGCSSILAFGRAGCVLKWPFEGLPPATYQLEITWPKLDQARLGQAVVPTRRAKVAIADAAGTVLHSEMVDQSAVPKGEADPARPGVTWHSLGSFAVAGLANKLTVELTLDESSAGSVTVADAVRLTRTSPDLSSRVGPGDVVTCSAEPGWVTTAVGPASGLKDLVIPHAGASLLPDPALTRPSMEVGWNACHEEPFSINFGHANLAKRLQFSGLAAVVRSDAKGYPTRLSAPSSTNLFAYNCPDGENNGPGASCSPNDPNGVWSIWWDDASGGSMPPPSLTPGEPVGAGVTGKPAGNRRYFRRVTGRGTSPTVSVTFFASGPKGPDGTYPCSIRNLKIYPPDPATGKAWADPPVWYPSTSGRISIGPFRGIDLTGAAASNGAEYDDFSPPDALSFFGMKNLSVPIASFANDPNADGYFHPDLGAVIRCTTGGPHGLRELDCVGLVPAPSGTLGVPTYTRKGKPDPGYGPFDGLRTFAHILSPTEFSFSAGFNRALDPAVGGSVMTNVLRPSGGTVTSGFAATVPFKDIAALSIESGSAPWVPIPTNCTDDCIARIAKDLLAIPKGTPIRIEYSNETWNSYALERGRFELLSQSMGLSKAPYDYVSSYLVRMKHCQDIVAGVFKAAGREGDVVRVCAAQQGYSAGTTGPLARYAAEHKIPIDEMSIAPYLEGTTLDTIATIPTELGARFDTYTIDQSVDLLELLVEYGPMRFTFQEHRGVIEAAGLRRPDGSPVRLTAYEGGFQTVIPGVTIGYTASTAANATLRSLAVLRHPRMYRVARRTLELAQLGGCTLWEEYRLGVKIDKTSWDKVTGYHQGYGTGDPGRDTANLAPFHPKTRIVSEVAGAYLDWSRQARAPSPR